MPIYGESTIFRTFEQEFSSGEKTKKQKIPSFCISPACINHVPNPRQLVTIMRSKPNKKLPNPKILDFSPRREPQETEEKMTK